MAPCVDVRKKCNLPLYSASDVGRNMTAASVNISFVDILRSEMRSQISLQHSIRTIQLNCDLKTPAACRYQRFNAAASEVIPMIGWVHSGYERRSKTVAQSPASISSDASRVFRPTRCPQTLRYTLLHSALFSHGQIWKTVDRAICSSATEADWITKLNHFVSYPIEILSRAPHIRYRYTNSSVNYNTATITRKPSWFKGMRATAMCVWRPLAKKSTANQRYRMRFPVDGQ